MSLKSEFENQWNSFASIVESELIRTLKENNNMTCEKVNTVIKREASRWNNSSQIQGIWINKLIQANPIAGNEFKNTILNIKVNNEPNIKIPSTAIYCAGVIISGGAGFLLSKLFNAELMKSIGFTIVPMFIFGSILAVSYRESDKNAKKEIVLFYMKQVNQYKDKLMNICKKAERY